MIVVYFLLLISWLLTFSDLYSNHKRVNELHEKINGLNERVSQVVDMIMQKMENEFNKRDQIEEE